MASDVRFFYIISFSAKNESGLAIVIAESEQSAVSSLRRMGKYNGKPDVYVILAIKNVGRYDGCAAGLILESYVNALVAFDALVSVMGQIVGPQGPVGPEGPEPVITADEDGNIYSDGELLTTAAADAAKRADEAREAIQDDLDKKVDKTSLVLLSDVEYQYLVDHHLVDPNKIYFCYEAEV